MILLYYLYELKWFCYTISLSEFSYQTQEYLNSKILLEVALHLLLNTNVAAILPHLVFDMLLLSFSDL